MFIREKSSDRAVKMLWHKTPDSEMEPFWRLGKKIDTYGFLVFPYFPKSTLHNLLINVEM